MTGAVLVVLTGAPSAQAPPPGVSVEISTGASTYSIGERVDVRVRLLAPSGSRVTGPEAPAQHGPFDLLRIVELDSEEESGVSAHTWDIHLTTFEAGRVTVPPFRFTVATGDAPPASVHSAPIDVTIRRPDVGADGELRPLRPPMTSPSRSRATSRVMAFLLVASVSAIGRMLLASRLTPRTRLGRALPVVLSPEQRLTALERRLPISPDQIAGFYTSVANIVRDVVQTSYGVPATTVSTRELVHAIRLQPHRALSGDELERFFATIDRVKFAGRRPLKMEDHLAVLARAGTLIRACKA